MTQIYANNFTTLVLGRRGENLARKVVFDIRDLESLYGTGDVEVIYQRPCDAQPYPVAVHRNGTLVTWDVTSTDTEMSDGSGKCELRYYVGETLAKSKTWRTWVEPAMDTPSETAPPEPEQGWVDQIISVGAAAKASADAAKADADRAAALAAEVAEKAAQAAQDASDAAKAMEAAQTAQRLAEEAQGAAETARTAAETAQAAAEQSATDAAGAKQDAETALKSAQDAAAAAANTLESIQTLYQEMQTWAQGVIQDVNDAGSVAVRSVQTTGDAQVQRVTAEGTRQTANAKAQADAAAQSASGAAQSAQQAAESASAASTSKTNAKASEESAKASETAAQASQTAAAGSASAAENSATSASASASAASESASAAAAFATAAKASEEAAKASETAAKASETAAAGSASAAQQSATSAAESASVYDTVVADVNQLKQDIGELDGVIFKSETAEINWSDYGSTRYPLGWRPGMYNKDTGANQNSEQLLKTYKLATFDVGSVITVNIPNDRYIYAVQYNSATAGADSFVCAINQPSNIVNDSEAFGRTLTFVAEEGAYYGFTIGYWKGGAIENLNEEFIAQVVGTVSLKTSFITNSTGNSETKVMSQKATTDALKDKQSKKPSKESGVLKGINLTSGNESSIDLKTFVRKNMRTVFSGQISDFTEIEIGWINRVWSDKSDYANRQKIVIDNTSIKVYQLDNSENSNLTNTISHGLTISDYLQVLVEVSGVNTAKISICCNGSVFHSDEIPFELINWYYPYIKASDCNVTDGTLGITFADLNKDIWIFGDSYTRYVDTRWTYYLHESGYDENCLINGHGGAKSTKEGWMSLEYLLRIGTPKYILWCFGMNDDGDTTMPSDKWTQGRDKLLEYCNAKGCIPIFTTIPTVWDGSVVKSHEKKNDWIRSSGYRYVDFAKAVGANPETGMWRDGLRESDTGLHPSALGAKVLFAQLLADFPEIMVSN